MGFFKSKEEKEFIKKLKDEEIEKQLNELVANKDEINREYAATQGMARCPRCGSTSLSGSNKGFGVGKALVGGTVAGPVGLVAGAIGSKKTVVTCLQCGYKWKL